MEKVRVGDLKLHLRDEKDGTGVLVVNAQAALFLDRIAVSYFQAFLDVALQEKKRRPSAYGDPSTAGTLAAPGVVKKVTKRFRVGAEKAKQDWLRLWGLCFR